MGGYLENSALLRIQPEDSFIVRGWLYPDLTTQAGDSVGIQIFIYDKDLVETDRLFEVITSQTDNAWNEFEFEIYPGSSASDAAFARLAFDVDYDGNTYTNGTDALIFDDVFFRRLIRTDELERGAVRIAYEDENSLVPVTLTTAGVAYKVGEISNITPAADSIYAVHVDVGFDSVLNEAVEVWVAVDGTQVGYKERFDPLGSSEGRHMTFLLRNDDFTGPAPYDVQVYAAKVSTNGGSCGRCIIQMSAHKR